MHMHMYVHVLVCVVWMCAVYDYVSLCLIVYIFGLPIDDFSLLFGQY